MGFKKHFINVFNDEDHLWFRLVWNSNYLFFFSFFLNLQNYWIRFSSFV